MKANLSIKCIHINALNVVLYFRHWNVTLVQLEFLCNKRLLPEMASNGEWPGIHWSKRVSDHFYTAHYVPQKRIQLLRDGFSSVCRFSERSGCIAFVRPVVQTCREERSAKNAGNATSLPP